MNAIMGMGELLKETALNAAQMNYVDQMPQMDGYAATASIRRWEQEQHRSQTPIVALTANAFQEELDKSLAAGCDAHLTKPIKRHILLEAICRYAGMKARREAA